MYRRICICVLLALVAGGSALAGWRSSHSCPLTDAELATLVGASDQLYCWPLSETYCCGVTRGCSAYTPCENPGTFCGRAYDFACSEGCEQTWGNSYCSDPVVKDLLCLNERPCECNLSEECENNPRYEWDEDCHGPVETKFPDCTFVECES